jgi:cardiolipin synthase
MRTLADQAFSRAAGAPLVSGNSIRLLKDAAENYPAWLNAIARATRSVHFESYIIHDDEVGERFADALVARAREGLRVRVIYDWMGGFGKTSHRFWRALRGGGVEVRCYNPPHVASPFGWLSRDHRKMLAVDGAVGFVTGLCVGRAWVGDPAGGIAPWRDTGVEIHGPAVGHIEHAFAQMWALMGDALPDVDHDSEATAAGDVALRIVATVPSMAGLLRLDLLVAAVARERLWLTDAYYAGTTAYVQALRSAARDGVDVRLLVPNGTDIPLLRPLSRSGYRTLLEAGVRIFEWNGPMLHAKTAVADGRWARVGSTNLNIASWLGNYELDVVAEDRAFARSMEGMYEDDLRNATEVVLDDRNRLQAQGSPRARPTASTDGSGGRAAAGLLRIGNTVGAAIANRRVLEPVEARIMIVAALVLLAVGVVVAFFPRLLAYPIAAGAIWIGAALLYRGYRLQRASRRARAIR